jgi:hypothetical protein
MFANYITLCITSGITLVEIIFPNLYSMSIDFVIILKNLIPEVIPRQKCHMNTGPVLNGQGTTDI